MGGAGTYSNGAGRNDDSGGYTGGRRDGYADGDGTDGYDDDGYDDGYDYDEHGQPILYDDGPRRSRRPLVLGVVALVVVAAIIVAFVALSGDDEPPARYSLAAAAQNAGRAERISFTLSARVDGAVVTEATGVMDLATGSQQIVTDEASAAAADGPQVGFVHDAPGRSVYVESSAFAATGLVFDRPYVRITTDALGDGVRLDTAVLLGRYGGNPLAVVPLIGRTAAQDLGGETIEEEQVEHFRVQVPLADVLDANPSVGTLLLIGDPDDESAEGSDTAADGSSSPATTTRPSTTTRGNSGSAPSSDATATDVDDSDAEQATVGTDEDTVVIDVYVTEDNVIRRLEFASSVPGAAIATVTFDEFDGDARVVLPASNQVTDLAQALGG